MSFVDKVTVSAIGGKGGDGKRSFRHERYISRGGPDGGDGGNGGDVILHANPNQNTLAAFRYKKLLVAKDGLPGGTSRKHGKNGLSLIVDVPVGTEVSANDQVIADLVIPNEQMVIAMGGKGGFGNAHFTSSTRQAPNFAEKGEKGEKQELIFELKLIADVGLVGLPNAGKSTLLSKVSNARPEIADYPFTTLSPNLGVVDIDEQNSILLADIPGLIEGAAEGKGLGHEFLRHIERTRLIVHLIDVYEPDVVQAYKTIRNELKSHSQKLAKLPEIVVLNKIDGYDVSELEEKLKALRSAVAKKTKLLSISARAGTNINELKFELVAELKAIKPPEKATAIPAIPRITLEDDPDYFKVVKSEEGYRISGEKIEKFASRTDYTNHEALDRLKSILKRLGITHELIRQGLKPGERIYIGENDSDGFYF
jgi:GTP-binding protein